MSAWSYREQESINGAKLLGSVYANAEIRSSLREEILDQGTRNHAVALVQTELKKLTQHMGTRKQDYIIFGTV